MDITSIVTSIFGGGITGLAGSALTAIMNYKTQKLKNEHDIALETVRQAGIKLEAEANLKITQVQTEGAIEVAEVEALKESYKSIQKDLFDASYMKGLMSSKWTRWIGALISLMFGLVDFLKAMARPVITYYLMIASTWVTIMAYQILTTYGTSITKDEALGLFQEIVTAILYMTITVVSWWFADRRMAKYASKFLDK